MSYRNIRPFHILWQEGIPGELLNSVYLGILQTLSLAEVLGKFQLNYFVQRREHDWLEKKGKLKEYKSLDWHIQLARAQTRLVGHLNSSVLLNSLGENPSLATNPRYEFVVVKEPLHWSAHSKRKVLGVGRQDQGALVTTFRRQTTDDPSFSLSLQMTVMHELGHVFGLFCKGTGKEDPSDDEIKKTHCLNECVMYWQDDDELNKKIKAHPFCASCLEKLKDYFIDPPTIIIDTDDLLDF